MPQDSVISIDAGSLGTQEKLSQDSLGTTVSLDATATRHYADSPSTPVVEYTAFPVVLEPMQPSTAAVSTMQPPIAAVGTSFSNFLANCTMLPTKTDHIGSHPATVADNTSISAIAELTQSPFVTHSTIAMYTEFLSSCVTAVSEPYIGLIQTHTGTDKLSEASNAQLTHNESKQTSLYTEFTASLVVNSQGADALTGTIAIADSQSGTAIDSTVYQQFLESCSTVSPLSAAIDCTLSDYHTVILSWWPTACSTEHSLTDHSVSHSQPIRQREFEVTGCLPARCSEWHSSVSTEQSLSNTDTVQTYTPVHARVLYTAARHYASFLATCSVPTTQTLPESVSAYCSPVYAKFLSQCTLSTDVHDRLSHITPKSHTHKRGSRGRGSRGRGSKGSSLQIDAARHAETAAVDLQQEQESFHLFLQEQDSIPRDNCLSIDSPTDQSSLHTGQGRTPDAPIEHTPQLATSQDLQQYHAYMQQQHIQMQQQHMYLQQQSSLASTQQSVQGSVTDASTLMTDASRLSDQLYTQVNYQQQVTHQLLQLHPSHERYHVLQQAIAQVQADSPISVGRSDTYQSPSLSTKTAVSVRVPPSVSAEHGISKEAQHSTEHVASKEAHDSMAHSTSASTESAGHMQLQEVSHSSQGTDSTSLTAMHMADQPTVLKPTEPQRPQPLIRFHSAGHMHGTDGPQYSPSLTEMHTDAGLTYAHTGTVHTYTDSVSLSAHQSTVKSTTLAEHTSDSSIAINDSKHSTMQPTSGFTFGRGSVRSGADLSQVMQAQSVAEDAEMPSSGVPSHAGTVLMDTRWAEDNNPSQHAPSQVNNIGQRLMEKQGWQIGTGLGISQQGATQVVSDTLPVQTSTAGLGSSSKEPLTPHKLATFNPTVKGHKTAITGGSRRSNTGFSYATTTSIQRQLSFPPVDVDSVQSQSECNWMYHPVEVADPKELALEALKSHFQQDSQMYELALLDDLMLQLISTFEDSIGHSKHPHGQWEFVFRSGHRFTNTSSHPQAPRNPEKEGLLLGSFIGSKIDATKVVAYMHRQYNARVDLLEPHRRFAVRLFRDAHTNPNGIYGKRVRSFPTVETWMAIMNGDIGYSVPGKYTQESLDWVILSSSMVLGGKVPVDQKFSR
jgi:hypothetical protein